MTFFALNPMVLMEAIGNGHNDMVMLAFMTLGLVLWQRDRWAWATLALTLATLVKITGLILMPLFGVAVLVAAPNWRTRILRGLGIAAIFLLTAGIAYRLTGPFPDVFTGARHAMFGRWGYTPSYDILAIMNEVSPYRGSVTSAVIAKVTRGIFILYFAYLLIRLAPGQNDAHPGRLPGLLQPAFTWNNLPHLVPHVVDSLCCSGTELTDLLAYLPVQPHRGAKHPDVPAFVALEIAKVELGSERSTQALLEFLDDHDNDHCTLGIWHSAHWSPAAKMEGSSAVY